jgi:hypothetical protein
MNLGCVYCGNKWSEDEGVNFSSHPIHQDCLLSGYGFDVKLWVKNYEYLTGERIVEVQKDREFSLKDATKMIEWLRVNRLNL